VEAAAETTRKGGKVPWVGVNHLALITNDMDATVRFWHGVLQADLVATVRRESFRHYFFRVGRTTTVAFFEYDRPTDAVAKPAGVYDPRAGHFDHVSLDLPDETAVLALQERLRAAGCDVSEVVDHGIVRSVYFTDPNGIALEASWWALLPPGDELPDFADDRYFGDDDPVPAVRELIDGRLRTVPGIRLVERVRAT
jgi:catechol 2,3-dioxygenase-like lactoylglutathione lyase family enzyme